MEFIDFDELDRQDEERNVTWNKNQLAISNAINLLSRNNERLPTQSEIAEQAGVDRKTVYMHLKEFKGTRKVVLDLEQLEAMSSKVLASLLKGAMEGDAKAVKLWLFVTGVMEKRKGG
jgi:DNA-directed RNA polymerase specialized sigma subunit